MAALKAGPREVADLVLRVPVRREETDGEKILLRRVVVLGEGERFRAGRKRRAGLDLQKIGRDVLRRKRREKFERALQRIRARTGQAEHQVEREVAHARFPQPSDRLRRAARRVPPPEHGKLAVVPGLHAERNAVHARRAERPCEVRRHVGGVRLGGDLRAGRDLERSAASSTMRRRAAPNRLGVPPPK